MSFTLNADGVKLTGAATGDAGQAIEYNFATLGSRMAAVEAAYIGKVTGAGDGNFAVFAADGAGNLVDSGVGIASLAGYVGNTNPVVYSTLTLEHDSTSGTVLFSVDSSGNVTGASFTGTGSGLTSLNASNISSGTLNAARLPSLSGTYLSLSAGGTVAGAVTANTGLTVNPGGTLGLQSYANSSGVTFNGINTVDSYSTFQLSNSVRGWQFSHRPSSDGTNPSGFSFWYNATTSNPGTWVLAGGVRTNGILFGTGGIGVGNSAAGSTLGTLVKKMQVFDANGNSLGYVPIYNSIT